MLSTFILSALSLLIAEDATTARPVSYYKDVRPIFQRDCHGCHQPAKAKGEYVMTAFEKLLAGGDEGKAVIPGDSAKSYLVERILPKDGKTDMPKGKKPLADTEIALIKKWIGEGAKDDTPDNAKQRYDMDHPPVYTLPPVITSIDYSPDGQLLAIAGFHEVILYKADGSAPVARLVGLSERIESVKFSPDGKRLAVTGGLPSRMGEVQVWDVEKKKLKLSLPITYDTVYGASWSPDGRLIAFGCADTTIRAIEAETGKQVLFQGAHDDWVLDTVFSVKGDQVVTVGRDRSTKLTEIKTQRFIDNLTSITPGALKGGLQSVARHPERDQVLVGGADGTPQVYRMLRETKRVIGDNANLIKRFPPMKGRIFGVDYSPDGKSIVCVSSHNGRGYLNIYSSEFDGKLTDDLKKILGKVAGSRKPDEKEKVRKYQNDGVKLLVSVEIEGGLYDVAFHPKGIQIAAVGADGQVRLINPADGKVTHTFMPVKLSKPDAKPRLAKTDQKSVHKITREKLEIPETIAALEVLPGQIQLNSNYDYVQSVVLAKLPSGDTIDVTRHATWKVTDQLVHVSPRGIVTGLKNGKGSMEFKFADKALAVPVTVTGLGAGYSVDYVRDVMPVISRLGCNAGTCHGAKEGKDGFKLSLRGYDPLYDVRAFTDDHASRRVNVASPDNSLMLMKATGSVPHEGSQLIQPGEKYYEIFRQWILKGAKLDLKSARVTSIEIAPRNPTVQKLGSRQQMRVVATYADGKKRDVTQEAFISSGNSDVATAEEQGGLVTTLRRGEAPILARFEGAYIATTLTVMGDRSGFAWVHPPTNNKIDSLAAAKWNRMKILPSGLCSDWEFIRRVTLDLIGLPPSAEEVESFENDYRDQQLKRDELIDQLVGSKEFVELWTNKWADLLQVNRKFLGTEGSGPFRMWIRNEIEKNTPYNEFVTKIVTAEGSNKENPPASYYKVLRKPAETMENTTHLFLATRFNCNKCHDHPFERWTQDQYYQTAAYFARVGLKKDPKGGNKQIGRTAVEKGKPLFEIIYEMEKGEVIHDRTGVVTAPQFPFEARYEVKKDATRRQRFAAWLTSKDNPYFARSYVNRIWGYLTGVGIIEPLDDIRAGNPPTNPELLDWLTAQFVSHKFDTQYLIRTICKSRVYQLSIKTNKWNQDDRINYSHATARRLPAEVLYDTVYKSLGAQSKFPGVPAGTRAAALPDAGVKLADGFLGNLGRPPRESACECERVNSLQLGPIMALVSGPTIDKAITAPGNIIAQLIKTESDDKKLIQALFMNILNRKATDAEIKAGMATIGMLETDATKLAAELAAYEKELGPILEKREKARTERIAKTKTELAAYEKEIAPREAQLDKEREEKIAKADAALKSFEPKLIEKLKAWETKQSGSTAWEILDLQKLKSSNGAKMEKQKDQSIFVSGKQGKTEYTFTAETKMKAITGLRLELLTDKRLPRKGPGRAPNNGNYVLTEFEVKGAPKDKPKELKKIQLTNAKANFSQKGYHVKTAIDGQVKDRGNGWATSPKVGQVRIATFETKQNFGSEKGSVFSFSMKQQYFDGKHTIGKFRISITDSAKPFKGGLSKNISNILKLAFDKRNDKQKAALLKYYKGIDPQQKKLAKALADAKKPKPVDPKLKMLKDKLAQVSMPLPEDSRLKQLKRDVDLSKNQLTNKRLIAAQDIAWALINNPAFLFNH